ncbi:MAG: hypothetical protein ACREBU_03825 [Nitrososphaera sp.]
MGRKVSTTITVRYQEFDSIVSKLPALKNHQSDTFDVVINRLLDGYKKRRVRGKLTQREALRLVQGGRLTMVKSNTSKSNDLAVRKAIAELMALNREMKQHLKEASI